MNLEQKLSWLIVVLFGLGLIGFLVLLPLTGPLVASAAFGVMGIAGLGPLLFRKKRLPEEVAEDERDKVIANRATLGGGMVAYVVFVAACMIPWSVCRLQGKESISIMALPLIACAGFIALAVFRAITVLVLYARGKTDVED